MPPTACYNSEREYGYATARESGAPAGRYTSKPIVDVIVTTEREESNKPSVEDQPGAKTPSGGRGRQKDATSAQE